MISDRTDSLLAELVELQRRQVANQEHAIATQNQSFAIQQEAVKRQRSAIRRLWTVISVVLLLILAQLAYGWFTYFSRH